MYVCVHIHMYTHVYTDVYTYIHMCSCVNICTHTHIYRPIHLKKAGTMKSPTWLRMPGEGAATEFGRPGFWGKPRKYESRGPEEGAILCIIYCIN